VRFTLDRVAFADRLGRFFGISPAGAAWIVATGLAVQFSFAMRRDQAATLDDGSTKMKEGFLDSVYLFPELIT
jgi:hypothetical protein